jgi:hypothetical protein
MNTIYGYHECMVELGDLIDDYERRFRPFPPRSGSVSKPTARPSHRAEMRHEWLTDEEMGRLKTAKPVLYSLDVE